MSQSADLPPNPQRSAPDACRPALTSTRAAAVASTNRPKRSGPDYRPLAGHRRGHCCCRRGTKPTPSPSISIQPRRRRLLPVAPGHTQRRIFPTLPRHFGGRRRLPFRPRSRAPARSPGSAAVGDPHGPQLRAQAAGELHHAGARQFPAPRATSFTTSTSATSARNCGSWSAGTADVHILTTSATRDHDEHPPTQPHSPLWPAATARYSRRQKDAAPSIRAQKDGHSNPTTTPAPHHPFTVVARIATTTQSPRVPDCFDPIE